jgi:hypothetical protein
VVDVVDVVGADRRAGWLVVDGSRPAAACLLVVPGSVATAVEPSPDPPRSPDGFDPVVSAEAVSVSASTPISDTSEVSKRRR